MKFKCVSCGAPRTSMKNKFEPCEYCSGIPEVTLAQDSSLLNSSLKNDLRKRIEATDCQELDWKAENSLIILYLLDNIVILAKQRVSKLLVKEGSNPYVLMMNVICILKERGITKSKISVIDEAVSQINLILSLEPNELSQEMKYILDKIDNFYYRKNGIKPSSKFNSLLQNLNSFPMANDCVISQILSK